MVKTLPECRRQGIDPWVGKSPWKWEGQPTSVCLTGEFRGQRSLAGDSLWGHEE